MTDIGDLEKLSYIFRQFNTLRALSSSQLSDYRKRVYMRYFFVVTDNFLKLIRKFKNDCHRSGNFDLSERRSIEAKIKVIEKSYENSYDSIRDKLTAHQQQLDLTETITWWTEIDAHAIEIFSSDLDEIASFLLAKFPGLDFNVDAELLNFTDDINSEIILDTSRVALVTPNAIAAIPLHESQHKASLITTAKRMLEADFYLTVKVDNPSTRFKAHVFDIAWFLVILDFTAMLDCLFDDAKEKSLRTYWQEGNFSGLTMLNEFPRNNTLETDMRNARNKMCAHLDSQQSIATSYQCYFELNLCEIHSYAVAIVNMFIQACRLDIRTKMYATDGACIPEAIELRKLGRDKPYIPN
jgi:hypothetical protein